MTKITNEIQYIKKAEYIIDLIEEKAMFLGNKVAIIAGEKKLTYSELNQEANKLANYLKKQGIKPNQLIGIFAERSIESVIGIIGILKIGCGYVPLDSKYPKERIDYIIHDAHIEAVLTQENLISSLKEIDGLDNIKIICIDQDYKNQLESKSIEVNKSLSNISCVVYTSGTTGKPKGVITSNKNIINYVHALAKRIKIIENDRYLHTASIAFSSSNRQLLLTLSLGATVVMTTYEEKMNPIAMFKLIKTQQVTVIDLVASHMRSCIKALNQLDDNERENLLDNHLRLILSASDALLSDIPKSWKYILKPGIKYINMYGSTETTGIVSTYEILDEDSEELKVIPIGKPLDSMQAYILDDNMIPVEENQIGMLYVTGSQITEGYLNKPQLTEKAFIMHNEQRLFRSGDLCKYNTKGDIEYIGRNDHQIKINGIRIEPKEIEMNLNKYCGIQESVVIAREVNNQKYLLAFFIQSNGEHVNISELRSFLKSKLPDYMIPLYFMMIDEIPLTPNGKVDYFSLPEVDTQSILGSLLMVKPRNDIEEKLCDIWKHVLKLKRVGVNNNFFELGGSSTLGFQILLEIYQEFNIDISVVKLFEYPTIERLALYIQNNFNKDNIKKRKRGIL
jgi:amino acid adenylation domain-containing protein